MELVFLVRLLACHTVCLFQVGLNKAMFNDSKLLTKLVLSDFLG